MPSPFSTIPTSAWVASNELAFAISDKYAVTEGHTLIITRRVVPTWFDASAEEQRAILALVDVVKRQLDASHAPDGYNVGFNAGEAAGQTVMHLHVHVIPRYHGDMADPRGGVRHVIPSQGNYLRDVGALYGIAPHRRPLVFGSGDDPLLPHLLAHMDRAVSLDAAVAFVLPRGVESVKAGAHALLERGGRLRLLTGDYLDATDPDALQQLCDLAELFPSLVELRVYEARARSFHPKTYITTMADGSGIAFVGSSNLSEAALRRGVEWNFRLVSTSDPDGFAFVQERFEALLHDSATVPLTREWVAQYRARRPIRYVPTQFGVDVVAEGPPEEADPHIQCR